MALVGATAWPQTLRLPSHSRLQRLRYPQQTSGRLPGWTQMNALGSRHSPREKPVAPALAGEAADGTLLHAPKKGQSHALFRRLTGGLEAVSIPSGLDR